MYGVFCRKVGLLGVGIKGFVYTMSLYTGILGWMMCCVSYAFEPWQTEQVSKLRRNGKIVDTHIACEPQTPGVAVKMN